VASHRANPHGFVDQRRPSPSAVGPAWGGTCPWRRWHVWPRVGSAGQDVSPRRRPPRSRTATLACGAVSEYEAADLVPVAGDVVPCRKHGHCRVVPRDRTDVGTARRAVSGPRRSSDELLVHLQRCGTASLRALREERFSLRLIAEAEKTGHLHVDLLAGVVAVQTASRPGRPSRPEPSTVGLTSQRPAVAGAAPAGRTAPTVEETTR